MLACVFVRFLEDNGLVDPPRLAGPGDRLALARDHHTVYFRAHPTRDRPRVPAVASSARRRALPAHGRSVRRAPQPALPPAASRPTAPATLLEFWQQIDPATGALVHDFTDPGWNTRFLGDLYQDLSEAARKTLRAAADAGVRRGVHPRPHARARDRGVRLPGRAADRPDLRLRPLPARRLPPPASSAGSDDEPGDQPARAGPARARRASPAWTSTRSPSRSRASGCWSRRCRPAASRAWRTRPPSGSTSPSGDSLLHGPRPARVGRGVQRDLLRRARSATSTRPRTPTSCAASSASATTPSSATRRTSRRRTRRSTRPTASASAPATGSTRSACRSRSGSSTWRCAEPDEPHRPASSG